VNLKNSYILESNSRILVGSSSLEKFVSNLADKITRFSFPLNGKMLQNEGVESVIIQKNFSLPDCVLIDKFITKEELSNLKYFMKSMFNYFQESNSNFRDLVKKDDEDTEDGSHELFFYMGK
jgi:hypothetical protein